MTAPIVRRARRLLVRGRFRLRSDGKASARPDPYGFSRSLDEEERALVERVQPYTMTPPERIIAARDAVEYVVVRDVPGALVECGVWRGGSVLTMILTLQRLGIDDRDVYLFDTFSGMTEPTEADGSSFAEHALQTWKKAAGAGRQAWDFWFKPEVYSLDQVRELLYSTGYPRERLHFVVGPVEETLPAQRPGPTALLRLDTDWYESTKHELIHLYPLLSEGGVLIVDDYGHWEGSRRAVDEFFGSAAAPIFLSRIDYAARIGIKKS